MASISLSKTLINTNDKSNLEDGGERADVDVGGARRDALEGEDDLHEFLVLRVERTQRVLDRPRLRLGRVNFRSRRACVW